MHSTDTETQRAAATRDTQQSSVSSRLESCLSVSRTVHSSISIALAVSLAGLGCRSICCCSLLSALPPPRSVSLCRHPSMFSLCVLLSALVSICASRCTRTCSSEAVCSESFGRRFSSYATRQQEQQCNTSNSHIIKCTYILSRHHTASHESQPSAARENRARIHTMHTHTCPQLCRRRADHSSPTAPQTQTNQPQAQKHTPHTHQAWPGRVRASASLTEHERGTHACCPNTAAKASPAGCPYLSVSEPAREPSSERSCVQVRRRLRPAGLQEKECAPAAGVSAGRVGVCVRARCGPRLASDTATERRNDAQLPRRREAARGSA